MEVKKIIVFLVLILLLLTVATNLVVLVWLVRSLRITWHGIGPIRVMDRSSISVAGSIVVRDALTAAKVSGLPNSDLTFEGGKSIRIQNMDGKRFSERSEIFLGKGQLNMTANEFNIRSPSGKLLFRVNRNQMYVGATTLHSGSERGFRGQIDTSLVTAEAGRNINVQTTHSELLLFGAQGVRINASQGYINSSSDNDFNLRSRMGAIKISGKVQLQGLPIYKVSSVPYTTEEISAGKVFQLCVCSKGKVFLNDPRFACQASTSFCEN